jgi:hypothetical protein
MLRILKFLASVQVEARSNNILGVIGVVGATLLGAFCFAGEEAATCGKFPI